MANSNSGTILGHPKGLYVLFFTELWERFSFYGMKTLLMLYMLEHFFWSQEKASGLLGWYAFLAYGLPIFGGLIADKWLGAKRAVVYGAILLSAGHLCMAIETMFFFYLALGLIIAGVGLLKPNVSTQVGSLYKADDPRRDGAFTIFYMGINLGALAGPLLCDWLRVKYGWSYGFGAAGVGMILGLIVYVIGQRKLVEFNQDVAADDSPDAGATQTSSPAEHPPHVIRDRIVVLFVVFAFVILFWTAFEQSPNAMLVWADKHTNLRLASSEPPPVTLEDTGAASDDGGSWFDHMEMTSGATQSFNPFFIITLAPVFAFFWIRLDKRGWQPSTPTKMVIGLVFVAVAFAVMWPASQLENHFSSAPLSGLPPGLTVDAQGRVLTMEKDGDRIVPTVHGASRLRYDAESQTLEMGGVLPDLDRFRILASTAPEEFKSEVEEASKQSAEGKIDKKVGRVYSLEHAPPGLASFVVRKADGEERPVIASWDADTKSLTAFAEINPRAKVELLAKAGQPELTRAVDKIYLESSKFRISVWWLIGFYLFLTMGELCISPVGLSLVTKLAPAKHVGLFMGGWFLATAIAEKAAQVFGAYWGKMPPDQYFMIFVVMCGVGALFMLLLIRRMKRMMHGVH